MMLFMLLFSRQGKLRLQKWYVAHPDKVKKKITRELITTILARYFLNEYLFHLVS